MFNKLLIRQIKRYLGSEAEIPENFSKLLNAVSHTYDHNESDRDLLERSMELSSQELSLANKKLRLEAESQKVVLDKLKESILYLQSGNGSKLTKDDIKDNDLLSISNSLRTQIEKRKEAEDKLLENEANLNALIGNTEDAIWSVDADFRLITFNSFFKKRFYWSSGIEPQVGLKFKIFVPRKQRSSWNDLYNRALKGERFFEIQSYKIESEINHFEVSFNPIISEKDITGVSVFSKNITPRIKNEERNADLMVELEIANKELKDLTYVTAHDFKTPLRGINTIVDWLILDYQDKLDENGNEKLNLLKSRVKRMYRLIDGILIYLSLESNKDRVKKVDINVLMHSLIKSMNIPSNIKIEIEGHLPTIRFEEHLIEKVFYNLLNNSVKFNDKPEGSIKVGCFDEEKLFKFYITDSGIGIEEKYFGKIFEIFETLHSKDEYESTGIGLPLSKKIINMYGGDIWIESELGKGSTFFFTIPK